MTYHNFTARCPHGFAIGVVECPECGTKVLYGASSHLRRAYERRSVGAVRQVPTEKRPGRPKRLRLAAERERAAG